MLSRFRKLSIEYSSKRNSGLKPYAFAAFLGISIFATALNVKAEELYDSWWISYNWRFKTPQEGCDFYYNVLLPNLDYLPEKNAYIGNGDSYRFACAMKYGNSWKYFGDIYPHNDTCPDKQYLSTASNACLPLESEGWPRRSEFCAVPGIIQGNPINIGNGLKIQQEIDLVRGNRSGIELYRTYSSLSGKWVHSYSAHLNLSNSTVDVVLNDGYVDHFKNTNGKFFSTLKQGSLLETADGWDYYTDDGSLSHFDNYGRLKKLAAPLKPTVNLAYDGADKVLIQSDDGGQIEIIFDSDYQPTSVIFTGGSIVYTYSNTASVATYTFGGQNHKRIYTYSNTARARLLESITDERGVQQAKWSYDNLGRPIFSEHADGTQHIDISYSDDSKTVTATNELRKLTKYHFFTISGVKRITSVEGDPSPNCPASNSSYTYTDQGLVLTKTDAKGFITTYSYNDRGLETSRTEASGTSQARVTSTEWDPTRFLRTKVVEPDRATVYSYDDQGRLINTQVTAR